MDGSGTYSAVASVVSAQTSVTASADEITGITRNANITIAKSANTVGPVNSNDVITYFYIVTNDGNVTVSDISIDVGHTGHGTPPVPSAETLLTDIAPTGDSTDAASNNMLWSNLAPGDSIRFSANYIVTQADVDLQQ
jgi:large repetitive protein